MTGDRSTIGGLHRQNERWSASLRALLGFWTENKSPTMIPAGSPVTGQEWLQKDGLLPKLAYCYFLVHIFYLMKMNVELVSDTKGYWVLICGLGDISQCQRTTNLICLTPEAKLEPKWTGAQKIDYLLNDHDWILFPVATCSTVAYRCNSKMVWIFQTNFSKRMIFLIP